jgi:hypothetical protein
MACLEQDLRDMGFMTAFSLARAKSFGMNVALSRHGYEYFGRMINNCRIMGSFEDMNIWQSGFNAFCTAGFPTEKPGLRGITMPRCAGRPSWPSWRFILKTVLPDSANHVIVSMISGQTERQRRC